MYASMISIDGSFGEGGGQILRTSLGLSLVTGKPVHITKIRAGRKKPGLRNQHLTAVKAAAAISQAECRGADIGSTDLVFIPGRIYPGEYWFSVGTAGSATLVLQTILPVLMTADTESHITIEGGTHNPYAPPFDFLEHVFIPVINAMGPCVHLSLKQYGFYPAGGGRFTVQITPAHKLKRLNLLERGNLKEMRVRAISSRLPMRIPRDEVNIILDHLGLKQESGIAEEVKSPGPGNAVMIIATYEKITALFTGFGQRGIPLQKVAGDTVIQARRYLENDVPVDIHLADQLLIPFAMAGGGKFKTLTPASHTKTNGEVIKHFFDMDIIQTKIEKDVWEIALIR